MYTKIIVIDQVEFAWGLANSNHYFLWIIRPDLVTGESAVLPLEFSAETKKRGFIAGWCPQEKVLNHPSIGGFLHTVVGIQPLRACLQGCP